MIESLMSKVYLSYKTEDEYLNLLENYKNDTAELSPKEGLNINPKLAFFVTEADILNSIPVEIIRKYKDIYGEISRLARQDPVKNLNWDYIHFVDSNYFRPAAIAFENSEKKVKGTTIKASYTSHVAGTKSYNEFWDEEFNRIINGYEPIIDGKKSGLRISGEFYFYLNYCRIKKIVVDKHGTPKDIEGFPDFLVMDFYYYKELEARENPEKLGLPGEYRKSMVVTKSRRKGFSFKAAAGCVWITAFNNNARVAIVSEPRTDDDTDAVKCAKKCIPIIDHLSNFTPFGRTDVGDPKHNGGWKHEIPKITKDYVSITMGIFNTKTKEKKGRQSTIFTMSLSKDDAASGEGLHRLYFEEAGKIANLDKAWTFARESMKAGSLFKGISIIFGCVTAGTKVWKNNGELVNIENLKKEDGILGFNGSETHNQNINWFKPPALKNCYKIKTTGSEIICSDDHPFVVTSRMSNIIINNIKHKKITHKEAKSLNIKDQILIPNSVPIFGNYNNKYARLIGLLIGDGCYKNSIQIGTSDQEIYNYIVQNVSNFNETKSKQFLTKNNKTYKYITIKDKVLKNILKKEGLWNQVKEEKRLPINIHEYSKESLSNLLGGYFDTDGNIRYNKNKDAYYIILTSVVYELLEQVKYQLIKFGIHCNIIKENRSINEVKLSKNQKDYVYRLYITKSQDVKAFKDNIKLLCHYKQNVLDSISDEWFNSKKQFGIIKKGVFIDNPNINKKNYMSDIITNCRYESVISVEEIGEKEVYNLNCSPNHIYICNTFITRQTGGEMLSTTGKSGSSKPFSVLFYNPIAAELANFKNIYEYREKDNEYCGYFISDMWSNFGSKVYLDGKKYIGLDHMGNAYFWVAELSLNLERREKEPPKTKMRDYNQFLTQRCKTPSEAFLITSSSVFNTADLIARRNELKLSKYGFELFRTPGELIEKSNGDVEFVPDLAKKFEPILSMDNLSNREGCLLVYEHPLKVQGKIPEDAYIITVDSIGKNNSGGSSLNSVIVLKTPKYAQILGPEKIVATYHGRKNERPLDYLHRLLMNLSKYYNAKITFENDQDGGILDYFVKKNALMRLLPSPMMVTKKHLPNSKTLLREFGHSTASDRHKSFGEMYVNEWLDYRHPTKRMLDSNDEIIVEQGKRNLDLIEDEFVLEQLINYNRDGNFDAVLALMGGIIQFQERFSEHEEGYSTTTDSNIKKEMMDYYYSLYSDDSSSSINYTLTPDGSISFTNSKKYNNSNESEDLSVDYIFNQNNESNYDDFVDLLN
jgi:hypothetical protein